jgi:hypothetical protein
MNIYNEVLYPGLGLSFEVADLKSPPNKNEYVRTKTETNKHSMA